MGGFLFTFSRVPTTTEQPFSLPALKQHNANTAIKTTVFMIPLSNR